MDWEKEEEGYVYGFKAADAVPIPTRLPANYVHFFIFHMQHLFQAFTSRVSSRELHFLFRFCCCPN